MHYNESDDSFDHWHIMSPIGEFILDKFDTEAEALAHATVLQSTYVGQGFHHIMGVLNICRCPGPSVWTAFREGWG